ncbi:hypothetical protein [Brevundimonas sp.]|uniref:hypothetical protein n=1 Tax=Brevundimonas sp. TaxID=1871086 RepID=UPI0035B4999F
MITDAITPPAWREVDRPAFPARGDQSRPEDDPRRQRVTEAAPEAPRKALEIGAERFAAALKPKVTMADIDALNARIERLVQEITRLAERLGSDQKHQDQRLARIEEALAEEAGRKA